MRQLKASKRRHERSWGRSSSQISPKVISLPAYSASGRKDRATAGKGFSLIELAIATCVIGLGVVSLVAVSGACTQSNAAGSKLVEAVVLAQEIREWTVTLPFSDPDDADAGNPPGSRFYLQH